MKQFFTSQSFLIGLAMFSMFFGAGNIIYPLAVGQFAGDKNIYAMAGLILTAALMPIAGVIAMILFDGSHEKFFGRLGKAPGFLLAFFVISLLGPLGSTPRCIALSYTTLKGTFLGTSPILFCALSCGVIYLFSFKKRHILSLLGLVLTPLLLVSLLTIILIGLFSTKQIESPDMTGGALFLHGLKEGYNTMDLLAAFFFSSTIINLLKMKNKEESTSYIGTAVRASIVGAVLLTLIYVGFSYLAAFHSSHLGSIAKDELLSAITMRIAGGYAGVLVCITIALACLTTAIALITAFSDFMHKEVLKERVSYQKTLLGALLVTFFVSTFKFSGISTFLSPLLEICYPGLIVLTFLNIAYRFKNFKPVKIPVFFAFVLALFAFFS